ncbi:hypothetical protein ACTXT7_002164 [Hymenolepis weldensis]
MARFSLLRVQSHFCNDVDRHKVYDRIHWNASEHGKQKKGSTKAKRGEDWSNPTLELTIKQAKLGQSNFLLAVLGKKSTNFLPTATMPTRSFIRAFSGAAETNVLP